jgi:hypothetical protein
MITPIDDALQPAPFTHGATAKGTPARTAIKVRGINRIVISAPAKSLLIGRSIILPSTQTIKAKWKSIGALPLSFVNAIDHLQLGRSNICDGEIVTET